MHSDMEEWLKIRQRVLVEGVSKRTVLRETGLHWQTLEEVLLEEDKQAPKKQRHTAKRLLARLRQEGYTGGYTQAKLAVREVKVRSREVFVPLARRPGEAQVDFGFAVVKVAGTLRRVVFFVMALPHSDGFFVAAFEHLCLETFWEGHVRAFEFFGGVPWRITYDNERMLVIEIIGAHGRRLTEGFLQRPREQDGAPLGLPFANVNAGSSHVPRPVDADEVSLGAGGGDLPDVPLGVDQECLLSLVGRWTVLGGLARQGERGQGEEKVEP